MLHSSWICWCLQPSDTASFLRPFGCGITCLLLSSCLLPPRRSSPDCQESHWRGGQFRFILFLSALLHVFICSVIGVQQLFPSLHAHLPCTILLARGTVRYGKKKKTFSGLWGCPLCGAPILPNMLNMLKSTSALLLLHCVQGWRLWYQSYSVMQQQASMWY